MDLLFLTQGEKAVRRRKQLEEKASLWRFNPIVHGGSEVALKHGVGGRGRFTTPS